MSSFDALFAYDIIAEPLGLWFLTRESSSSELVTQTSPTMRPGTRIAHQREERDTLFASVPTIDLAGVIAEHGLFDEHDVSDVQDVFDERDLFELGLFEEQGLFDS